MPNVDPVSTRTDDIEDPGFGTQIVVESLEQRLDEESSRVDTVLVNIKTLIRNRCRKDINVDTLLNEVMDDIRVIGHQLANSMMKGGVVVFYSLDYRDAIPPDFRRKTPPSKEHIETAWATMRRTLKQGKWSVDGVDILVLPVPWKKTITDSLDRMVKSLSTSSRLTMTSHVACDLHLARKYPDMKLVESFTGKWLSPIDFAEKVFGTAELPFHPCTHAVIGDSDMIKRSVVGKPKKELIALATREHWRFKKEKSVEIRLRRAGYMSSHVKYPKL